ncbi:hypothetical protein QZM18_08115 [Burkholderia diffusa]|uniref:hypothetical protein n=1 Tax=Burkholderia diffusa TaxID=488732 RepID=UPI002652E4D5|nr:hypothetical protein [Burkholderia diffusa]MDN7904093.1 hypothetical protein [Burkholderia diffusa]
MHAPRDDVARRACSARARIFRAFPRTITTTRHPMPRLPAARRAFMIAAAGLLSAAALPRAACAASPLLDAANTNAPSPIFAGKRVANDGRCNAYNPRT